MANTRYFITCKHDVDTYFGRDGKVHRGILTFGNVSWSCRVFTYRKTAEKWLNSVNYRWSNAGPFVLRDAATNSIVSE